MASLKNRVMQQRDAVIARKADIHWRSERTCMRLRHPVILIPAFLGGMLAARGAPVILRALPTLTARLGYFSEDLSNLNAKVRLIATLVPALLGSISTARDDLTRSASTVTKL